jgi:sirohydrochlorin ferrochelatase
LLDLLTGVASSGTRDALDDWRGNFYGRRGDVIVVVDLDLRNGQALSLRENLVDGYNGHV